MTLAEKAIIALKAGGIDARKPANYKGECKQPYAIVQDAGEEKIGKGVCRKTVVVYVYAPYNQPQLLNSTISAARNAMTSIEALKITSVSVESIDNEYKAITAAMSYQALCAK